MDDVLDPVLYKDVEDGVAILIVIVRVERDQYLLKGRHGISSLKLGGTSADGLLRGRPRHQFAGRPTHIPTTAYRLVVAMANHH